MFVASLRFLVFFSLALLPFLSACAASRQVRYTPARWVRDNDQIPIKAPKPRQEYSLADGLNYQFFYQVERLVDIPLRGERSLHAMGLSTLQEAHNTNNFDEVADSTWFTNKMGKLPLSPEEVQRGPGTGKGPDPKGPWKIIRAKKAGVSSGFMIEDAQGVKYIIKFDPPKFPELSTAAEAISTRIIHAAGYNVPETHIVFFSPSIVSISPELSKKSGKDAFTQENLDKLFGRFTPDSEGRYRALASRYIEGKLLGPFSLRGRRRGDKNDRIPHEHRRELRGYRTFSAFLSNADAREGNTLDAFLKTGPDDQGYIKHYVLDFGSSLGSSATKPKEKPHLDDYVFNYGKVLGSAVTLGGYQPDWDKAYDPEMPSVGLFQSKVFKPQSWRPFYPNPIFQYTTDRDGFWATKILVRLRDEHIAAAVKAGQYSDPKAEAYVTRTLIERRDIIRNHWFSIMNPLDDFQLSAAGDGVRVSFQDLGIFSGLYPAGSGTYRYRLEKEKGNDELIPWTQTTATSVQLTGTAVAKMQAGKFYLLQLQTKRPEEKKFGPTIDLILKKDDAVQLMGLKRHYKS